MSRAYGILRTAQTISSEETMHLLSSVRMGVNLGLIPDLQIADINELFIHTQPAHLQKRTGGDSAAPTATSSVPGICGSISIRKTGRVRIDAVGPRDSSIDAAVLAVSNVDLASFVLRIPLPGHFALTFRSSTPEGLL